MIPHASTKSLLAIVLCVAALSPAHGQSHLEAGSVQTTLGDSEFLTQATSEPIFASLGDQQQPLSHAAVSQNLLYGTAPQYATAPEAVVAYADEYHGSSQHDIVYSQEVESLAAESSPGRNWRERIRNHYWDASANAVTSGMTASIFGGPGVMPSYFDGFGRTTGGEEFTGGVIGLSVGKRFNSRWRSEIEVSWRKREMTRYYFPYYSTPFVVSRLSGSGYELDTFAGMVNMYYDFDRGPGKIVTPYFGFGLGASYEETSTRYYTSDKTNFAIQGMAGLSIHLSRQNEFYFETRAFSQIHDDYYRSGYHARTSSDLIFGLRRTF